MATTLGTILTGVLHWVSAGTVARMQMSEPGIVTIKFDGKKYYLDANDQHFPFKRLEDFKTDNSQSS